MKKTVKLRTSKLPGAIKMVLNEKIWNWCEIKDIDIEDVSVKYNLAPYEPEAFQEAVWVCKIKEK